VGWVFFFFGVGGGVEGGCLFGNSFAGSNSVGSMMPVRSRRFRTWEATKRGFMKNASHFSQGSQFYGAIFESDRKREGRHVDRAIPPCPPAGSQTRRGRACGATVIADQG